MNPKIKRVFTVVFVTQLIDLLAFTLILPLLPKLLDFYTENDKSGLYHSIESNFTNVFSKLINPSTSSNQVLLAGLLGSWFSLLQFMSSPFVGALSDRFGRKPILLMAMSGSLLSYSIWFCAHESFALFVLSRTIGGLSKSTVGLSLAIIADVSDDQTRGKGMALIGSSFSVAFIIGPSIGAYLSTLASGENIQSNLIRNPATIAVLLSLVNLLLVSVFLSETNESHSDNQKNVQSTTSKKKQACEHLSALSSPSVIHYINPMSLLSFKLIQRHSVEQVEILKKTGMIYFLYLLFYSGLEFTLSFLTHMRFGFSSTDQSKLYLFSGIIMVSIQAGFVRRLGSGRESLNAFIGLVSIVPSFILMGLSNSVSMIYYSLILYSFSSAIVVPCLTTIVSTYSPEHSKGVVLGTLRSLGALARALGPALASLFFWTLGPTMCYLLGATALLWPIALMNTLHPKLKNRYNQDSSHKVRLIEKNSLAKAN